MRFTARVVLRWGRRNAKLIREIAAELADVPVVASEHGAELPYLGRVAPLGGKRSGLDVGCIRGVEDSDDGGII
jgi:hypothetical protein